MPVYKLTDLRTRHSYWMLAGSPKHAKTVLFSVLDLKPHNLADVDCGLDFQHAPPFGFIEHENGSLTEIPWDTAGFGLEP